MSLFFFIPALRLWALGTRGTFNMRALGIMADDNELGRSICTCALCTHKSSAIARTVLCGLAYVRSNFAYANSISYSDSK